MELIDTHSHIFLEEFDKDRENLLKRAVEAGVSQILLPAIDSSTHAELHDAAALPGCRAMIGLHPCSVKENFKEELILIRQLIKKNKYVAVGEIGLDYYWDTTFSKEQQEVFEEQLQLAIELGLPVSIHSRNATDECIQTVQKFKNLKGAFHCFSGDAKQAEQIMEAGL